MKLFVFVGLLAICLVQASALLTDVEQSRAWPPLKTPPIPETPPRSRCDAPDCNGLGIYLQPTHEPTQFFQCTILGRYLVLTCPIGLLFSYSRQTCVLPRNWEDHC